jgi:hypothetical protein
MNKKAAVFSLLLAAAVCCASSANARIATKLVGAYVMISPEWEYNPEYGVISEDPICDYYQFPYRQRMAVQGAGSEMVLTEFIYPVGRHTLSTEGLLCDGETIVYNAGTCAC